MLHVSLELSTKVFILAISQPNERINFFKKITISLAMANNKNSAKFSSEQ